jgi:hypothetical protein
VRNREREKEREIERERKREKGREREREKEKERERKRKRERVTRTWMFVRLEAVAFRLKGATLHSTYHVSLSSCGSSLSLSLSFVFKFVCISLFFISFICIFPSNDGFSFPSLLPFVY